MNKKKGKTIAQIAAEIGVTKQAVMYHLKKLESTKENGVLSTKENGVLLVSLSGESLIKSAFSKNDRQAFGDKQPPKDRQIESDILAVLQDTISALQGQLSVKDKQIDELNTRLAESNAALVAAQQTAQAAQALHAGSIQQQLSSNIDPAQHQSEMVVEEDSKQTKKGFFARVFSR